MMDRYWCDPCDTEVEAYTEDGLTLCGYCGSFDLYTWTPRKDEVPMAHPGMISVIVVEPLKAPYVTQIKNELAAMQAVVGGYIECIRPWDDLNLDLYCNEEGKITGLPMNRTITNSQGKVLDVIRGTFFVSRADDEGNQVDVTEDDVRRIATMFGPASGSMVIAIPKG